MLPPESATLPPDAVAVPPQVVAAFGVTAAVTFVGNVSVRATPLNATALVAVFATVIVRVDAPPKTIDVGEKVFAIATGGATVNVAVAGALLVTPCVVETLEAATVLT
jgi:hypothetical protein